MIVFMILTFLRVLTRAFLVHPQFSPEPLVFPRHLKCHPQSRCLGFKCPMQGSWCRVPVSQFIFPESSPPALSRALCPNRLRRSRFSDASSSMASTCESFLALLRQVLRQVLPSRTLKRASLPNALLLKENKNSSILANTVSI